MRFKLLWLKNTFISNKKIAENYFFMTLLLVLNSFFGLLIYPYLIRTLGAELYGVYIFASTVVNYFICFIGFGFDMYGVRLIAENPFSIKKKSNVLSIIFTTKLYLEIVSIILAILVSFVFPILRTYFWVYIVCFANTLLNIFFPTWYFQGVQKMRVVSYIQLIFKLLSLPFIFICIKKPDDILLFAIIMTASSLLGALYAFIHLLVFEKLKISLVPIKHTLVYIKESQYFFYTNFLNMMKIQTINLIIGTRYSMTDLALYDLANRIVSIPLMLITNINSALFPKVVSNFNVPLIKKILRTERIIGILAVLTVVVFGKIAIQILGGETMEGSYWIAVILSFTIFAFLQTSCYIGLILIPNRKDSYVLKDLILSFTTLFTLIVLGMLLSKNILALPLAFSLAALVELLYLRNVSKKILI
ncbi:MULTISPECIES: oligosaccharide flippase family protein [Capnocytophaga]|uniref:oligosaccharide flippase family protein n=1 Tax=Capnocytophaga TaxID=1016 RepID=UPI00020C77A5|nr:oligosaccharide flippase family protein [Capnocytophaga sp. FDAARGOS_737]QGS16786.1 oligosaccharide flippase family protein [Capnocytophaga sp. FDAARGOS_737]